LAIPLLTSSLTTIFAFLPMLLIDGQTGEYAFSLPMVVILLLLSSWFLSMYMTPAMCFWFMKVKPKNGLTTEDKGSAEAPEEPSEEDAYSGRFYQIYLGILAKMLHMRIIVVIAAAGENHRGDCGRRLYCSRRTACLPAGQGVFRAQ
jgi:multidrug efflux pump subunit AcrB